MRKATDQRDAQTISLLWTSLLLFHGGHVTCFDVMKVLAGWGDVGWAPVVSNVMWWAVISCALQWDGMLWAWDAIGCGVTLCGSKWFCDDVVIQSTFLYYKVLLQHYSVLQSTVALMIDPWHLGNVVCNAQSK